MRTEKCNERFSVAFGTDGTTGPFVLVWHLPVEAQDGAFININNMGVEVDEDQPVSVKDIIGASAWSYLMAIKVRYALARENGTRIPHIDAQTASIFLTKLGFSGLGKEIQAAFS